MILIARFEFLAFDFVVDDEFIYGHFEFLAFDLHVSLYKGRVYW